MTLPYAGYSWQFTQHSVALDPETLYTLLTVASEFEGQEGVRDQINRRLDQEGILTANIRNGEPDAWRDYQQVLPELGLIYSTHQHRQIRTTIVGKLFLAGDIGASELIQTQALRYQYPNGHKRTISARLRQLAAEAGDRIDTPTLTEFQASREVLVKPGLLLLRVLLTLHDLNQSGPLSVDEVLACLVPVRKNADWTQGVDAVLSRRRSRRQGGYTPAERRSVQEWFHLLGRSDLFVEIDGKLSLSGDSTERSGELTAYCTANEDPGRFWIPSDFSHSGLLRWFDYFGTPQLDEQLLAPEGALSDAYLAQNYRGGAFQEDSFAEIRTAGIPAVQLVEAQPRIHASSEHPSDEQSLEDLRTAHERLQSSIELRRARHALHDSIVAELAQAFRASGALVREDRDSVDLLAQWPECKPTIFEVKTVSRRNAVARMRLGVGQLFEYKYRLRAEFAGEVECVLVTSTILPRDHWYSPFLTDYLGIGVLGRASTSFSGVAPGGIDSGRHWREIRLS